MSKKQSDNNQRKLDKVLDRLSSEREKKHDDSDLLIDDSDV